MPTWRAGVSPPRRMYGEIFARYIIRESVDSLCRDGADMLVSAPDPFLQCACAKGGGARRKGSGDTA